MTLSIIIPVFNAMPYLQTLLSNIESQDREEIEIILINDGSTDSSGETCAKAHFINCHIINQKNEGLCSARNRGIHVAKGEYLWFIDADDLLPLGIIDKIISFLRRQEIKYDIVNCNYVHMINDVICWESNFPINNIKLSTLNSFERINYLYGVIKYNWAIWNNLFRRKFIIDNKLYFNDNFFNYEDGEFNVNAVLKAKRTFFWNEKIYCYRKDNPKSRTKHEKSFKYFYDAHFFCVKWYKFFQVTNNIYDNREILSRISLSYKYLLRLITNLNKEDRRKALNLYKKYNYIVTAYGDLGE